LEIGKELGCTSVKLIVRDRNINAKNFYLKNGFVPGGTLMFLNLADDKELEIND
jgi:ribosomal protein S18 acetylase RimI-like enzyme